MNEGFNWENAQKTCESHDAHLVEINTEQEQVLLRAEVKKRLQPYWIGLTDKEKEGTWIWAKSRKEATFFNWRGSQPPRLRIGDCVSIMETDGKWLNYGCDVIIAGGKAFGALCELKKGRNFL